MTDRNNNIPKLRFPGFKGNWACMALNEVFELRNGYTPSTGNPTFWENGTIPWFRMEDIRVNGHILSDAIQHITPDAVKRGGLFEKGSFILATTATIGEHALLIADSLANQRFTNLRIRESLESKLDTIYLYYYLFIVDEFCKVNVNQGGFYSVNMGSLKKCPIFFPPLPEQKKIAEFLSSVDDVIAAESDRLTALKDHKKGLMQQLFPQKGQTQPAKRFPGFNGEWEVKILGEIGVLKKGKGISKAETDPNGQIPCVRYGELYTKYGEQISKVVSRTNLPITDLVLSEVNDILIPSSGETREDIATASCVLLPGVAVGGDINIIKTSLNGVFLAYYLNCTLRNSIAKIAQGDAVVHLYGEQLKKFNISFPSISEQKKIADCLTSLDDEIQAQQQKVDALKDHKRGLMQKLFPHID